MGRMFHFNSDNSSKEQLTLRFEAEAIPHFPLLKRIAYQLMRNQAEAEDLVQETFVQALQSFAHYESGTNCRAWLCKIMFRKRSHRYRVNARYLPLDESNNQFISSFQTSLPTEYIGDKLSLAVLALPENFRKIVLLCDVEELTYREVAELLEIPIGTVMSRLHRGRKMLRKTFAEATIKCRINH